MRAIYDADGNFGIAAGKIGDGLRKLDPAVTAQIADPQAHAMTIAFRSGLPHQLIGIFQQLFAARIKERAGRSQREMPVFPVDQLHAQLLFEGTDLL